VKTAYTLSIVIGSLLIIGGVATWIVVSTALADQKIVVSDDASCLAGDEVDGSFSAYCEAMVIDKHALEATGGLRYAELDREDPKRQTAQTPRSSRLRCSPRWWPLGWRPWPSRSACCSS
jgi:hypothetical protein